MNFGMAVGTSRIESPLAFQTGSPACKAIQPVSDMALQAKKRNTKLEKIIVDRAMVAVAVHAVFRDVRVFKKIRPALFRVARSACFLYRYALQEAFRGCAVRIMAVGAVHFVFLYRMMAGQREFRPDFLMAFHTHILHRARRRYQVGALVDGMAVGAGDII